MASEPERDTTVPSPTEAADRATPAATPVQINGTAVPAGGPPAVNTTTADGETRISQELFRRGDVSISREQVPSGDQYADLVVISTGPGNDNVRVDQRTDGTLDVRINGERYDITLAPGQDLAVRSGDGNDVVHATGRVTANMDVDGGAGNDRITTGAGNDRIDGGAGNDRIVGGAGRDDIFGNSGNDDISGGDGNDVIYGGDGDDKLRGQRGNDYLEGGRGADALSGGSGNDVLSGGQGNDSLRGDTGDDTVYTGAGADRVANNYGNDRVFGQAEDTLVAGRTASNTLTTVDMTAPVGDTVTVAGSDAFRQRTEADIEMLRSSPVGREMLGELDGAAAKGNSVTISELENTRNGYASASPTGTFLTTDATGKVVAGPGADASVAYNPSNHDDRFPAPVGVLFHELSHNYNMVTGTRQPGTHTGGIDSGMNNRELQAVGLENSGLPYDFDRNPATPDTTANPRNLSENGLRAEMGQAERPSYNLPATPPAATPPAGASPAVPGGAASGTGAGTGVGDPHLDRMLEAVQSGDRAALRTATQDLSASPFGQDFRKEGAAALERQAPAPQVERAPVEPTPVPPQMEAAAISAGPRR